jgi:hypothetical protein
MFCSKCGNEITIDGAKYCHKCGYDLNLATKEKSSSLKSVIDSALTNQPHPASFNKEDVSSEQKTEQLKPTQNVILPIKWWKAPSQIARYFFGTVALFIFIALVLSIFKSNLSDTVTLIYVAGIIIGTLALVIYKYKSWGWGWYYLTYGSYTTIQKGYTKYGIYQTLLEIVGIFTTLFIYFALRSKYLTQIKVLWVRSLLSGVISLFVVGAFIAVIANFIPTQDQRVGNLFQDETQAIQNNVKIFSEQNQKLWSGFIPEPSSLEEFQSNLAIVNAALPLYHQKDSVLVNIWKNIYSKFKNIYEETSSPQLSINFKPSDILNIVDKSEDISKNDESMLLNLSSYYHSIIVADGDHKQYWNNYQKSIEQLNIASQDYTLLCNKLGGTALSNDVQKK